MKNIINPFCIICIVLLHSCGELFDDVGNPDIQPNILGPVAYTSIAINDMISFLDQTFEFEVSKTELGLPVDTLTIIPEINFDEKILIGYSQLNPSLRHVTINDARVSNVITNTLPVAIKSGLQIEINDSISGNNILNIVLSESILPNESISLNTLIQDKTLNNTIEINLMNLGLESSDYAFVEIDNLPLLVSLEFEIFEIEEFSLTDGFDFSVQGVTNLDFNAEDVDTDAVFGKIYMFVENNFAFDTQIQLDVLDNLNNVDYSFFEGDNSLIINSSTIENNYSSAPYISDPITMIEKEENQASGLEALIDGDKLRFDVSLATPELNSGYVNYRKTDSLIILLTADLIIDASK